MTIDKKSSYISKWKKINYNFIVNKGLENKIFDLIDEIFNQKDVSYTLHSILKREKDKMEDLSFYYVLDFILWYCEETKKEINKSLLEMSKNKNGYNSLSHGKRSDANFQWALDFDITLFQWVYSFSLFLNLQNKSYNLYRQACINFLDYLIEFPQITKRPLQYININYKPITTFKDYVIEIKKLNQKSTGLRNNIAKLNDFFDWFLINNCMDKNNSGQISNEFRNPIVRITLKPIKKVETYRNSLPIKYIKQLEEIITENDFAWPKTLRNEWMIYKDEKIWSPITSYLILLKLKTPLRTFQLRYLDSGEGDEFNFDYDNWKWIKNENICNKEDKGVLKKIIDKNSNKEFVGLYINTNKTNDINKEKKGYIIPWENKDVIKIISNLIKWQKKYNPVNKPYKWIDIDDIQLKKKSESTLLEMGDNFFLFRDIANKNSQEPILDSRVQYYWKMLLAELEKRINFQRDLIKKEPIYFIKKWQGRKPLVSYYDLHSLRVTNITALYQAGVPYSILSKYVAGHSTVLMTIYYTKFNQSHISDALNEATKQISLKEQENFNDFLANANYEELNERVIYNDISSINVIEQLDNKSSILSDIGICPVGENKCDEGGEEILSHANIKTYAPVANGPKNCIRCRFFITGVPFLIGLSAKFNELSVLIKEKSSKYRKSQNLFEQLYNERYISEKENKPFLKWKDLEFAESNYTKYNNELDQLLIDWQTLCNLIEQCQVLQGKNKSEDKLKLITNDSIDNINVLINECSDFELYDSVCQSSVFYESIHPNIANIKRNKIINKMLLNNDIQPYFIFLDEDEALISANQFSKYLISQIGKQNTFDIMENKKKLKDFGISIDIKNKLENILEEQYEFKNKLLIKVNNE